MKQTVKALIGGLAGAGIGWLAYRFIGCKTGACPITANPLTAMLFFGIGGLLIMLTDSIQKDKKPLQENNHVDDE